MNTTVYEVQHYTFCDGWINTWTICDDEVNEIPERFQSYDEALIALNEHLDDMKFEYQIGNLDTCYHASDYRIVQLEEVTA